jgi:hypothetical protein
VEECGFFGGMGVMRASTVYKILYCYIVTGRACATMV